VDHVVPHEITLERDPASIARARRHFIDTAPASLPPSVLDAGTLAVSELVTNAVVHGGGTIVLRVTALPRVVRIAVTDDGDARPQPATQTEGERGRGLEILDRVTAGWGCDPCVQTAGKTVWCELPVNA
jgi:anti-sigma regulatory factor (Ser/Thr protein kinase)